MTYQTDQGYTLLELLVAIAIMALAAVPLSDGLLTGIRTWESSHERGQKVVSTMAVRKRLASWIANAYAFDPLRHDGGVDFPIVGQSQQISFVTNLSPDKRSDEYYHVDLSLSDDNALVANIVSDHNDADSDQAIVAELLDDISSIELTYLDGNHGIGGAWVGSWQDQLRLPLAVKVSIVFLDATITWPDLIIPIKGEEWAHCAFDAVTQSCFSGVEAG